MFNYSLQSWNCQSYSDRSLLKKGFEIIMLVRDSGKSRMAYEEIKSASGGKIKLKYIDLASLDSIKIISKEIKPQYDTVGFPKTVRLKED